jgi:hypothetical protein
MKKILVIMAVALATVGGCTGCTNQYGIHETKGYAVNGTAFNIEGDIFEIYDDVLEAGETYIITTDGKDTPFPEDDEILNYMDLETYELNGGRI